MRIVDLTHTFDDGMPVFPGLPEPSFRAIANVSDDGYAMTELHLLNHVGTHIDALAHQIADGDTLDAIPFGRLVTDAVTIDVSARQPGPITLSELQPHLEAVRSGDIVFMYSDNARNLFAMAREGGMPRQFTWTHQTVPGQVVPGRG